MLLVRFIPAAIVIALTAPLPAQLPTPTAAVTALLDADRAFAAAAGQTDAISALSAMFAPDVTMPVSRRGLVNGRDSVRAVLAATPANTTARLTWAPIRGAIAADGTQGFTFGFMTQTNADGSVVPFRYLAYWVKRAEGWRVATYKRVRRGEGEVSSAMLPPLLPSAMVAVVSDPAVTRRIADGLADAERTFSADAQLIGLGPAFARHGSDEAMNLGSPANVSFTFGAAAIAKAIGDNNPEPTSPLSWGPERVIAASSGDLGVTIGMIYPNARPADGSKPAGYPFFTVWRRAGPGQPWRYVAE